MKKWTKFLSTFLLIVGIGALCYGCVELVGLIKDTKQTVQEPLPPDASHVSESTDINEPPATPESSGGTNETPAAPESSGGTNEIPATSGSESSVSAGSESQESSVATESQPGSDVPADSPTESQPGSDMPAESPTPTEAPYVSPYAAFFETYPDLVAWLSIPDTIINYPVMWTPFDENHYLYRHYDGTENKNGSLILDTDSSLDPLTTNLIIHGHDMRSGAMFGNLTDYAKKSYYEQHKEMLLFTADCERKYEVIAVFYSQVFKKKDTVFKFYKFFQADTQEEFDDFYENIMALSLYDTGVTAEFGDRFITLSTCSSHVENGRFVVVAKECQN